MPLMDLERRIDELWDEGGVDEGPIVETIDLLDRGELRVAEPGADGWVVNEWAKKAILLYFRLRKVEPAIQESAPRVLARLGEARARI